MFVSKMGITVPLDRLQYFILIRYLHSGSVTFSEEKEFARRSDLKLRELHKLLTFFNFIGC